MGTPVVYPQFKLRQHNGNAINFTGAGMKLLIVDGTYTPSNAHATKADVTGEVSGTGYTARGIALAGKTLALDGTVLEFAHDDITIPQSAGAGFSNGRTLIWYYDTGSDATSGLVMYDQQASAFGNVAGDLIIDGSAATGVLAL